MHLFVGTSGYSYKEWKGPFYPKDLAAAKMLGFYASQLSTVEINNTFYRMPKSEVMQRWAEEVPEDFRFVIKASQRITHRARLKNAEEPLGYLWSAVSHLGERLGPMLFQLPPNFKKDTERLREFLSILPAECRPVLEFRHDSWVDEEVHDLLRERGAALCKNDDEPKEEPKEEPAEEPADELVSTADWGYLRLRRNDYDAGALAHWAERIRAQPWREAWVYFKHEDGGAAPRMARELAALFSG